MVTSIQYSTLYTVLISIYTLISIIFNKKGHSASLDTVPVPAIHRVRYCNLQIGTLFVIHSGTVYRRQECLGKYSNSTILSPISVGVLREKLQEEFSMLM